MSRATLEAVIQGELTECGYCPRADHWYPLHAVTEPHTCPLCGWPLPAGLEIAGCVRCFDCGDYLPTNVARLHECVL